jgi:RNA-directed DNA polymerase
MDIGEMQKRLSLKAEQQPDHRFDDLFSLIGREDWLMLAHDHVASNAGSETAGCDGINLRTFDEDLEGNLKGLREALKKGTFRPDPVRRVFIPKSNGKLRPLGIPSIRDRIVQEAVRMALEPIYEADFLQCSYGFRPNRCTMDAIDHARWYMQESMKFFWIIEGDISSYFDAINHRKLMKLLGRRVKDGDFLDLIWSFLRAGVMERQLFKGTNTGTPQGGIVSPLLANVYLHELDKFMKRYTDLPLREKEKRRKAGLGNTAYVRYADDFVVLCNGSKDQAYALRDELQEFLSDELRLTLSMEKTKVTHLNEGFIFLGFGIQRGPAMNGGMTTRVLIPTKAIKKHLDVMKAAFSPSTHEDSVILKFPEVNKVISGWCRYYQCTSRAATQFSRVQHLVYWLAAHWLARKYQCSCKSAIIRFRQGSTLGTALSRLAMHSNFRTQRSRRRHRPFPNPYTSEEVLTREKLPEGQTRLVTEQRKGSEDRRREIMARDNYTCQWPGCGVKVTLGTGHVDHLRPRYVFLWRTDADKPENLWTLCLEHHRIKTENDRQRESRVH